MNNRERIVLAAIELMNERGSVVGTNQLAQYLRISPGNLYYHFRNREAILSEILARISAELDQELLAGHAGPLPAEQLAATAVGGVQVLWRYRFFFSAALELVARDADLRQQYATACARGIAQLDALLAGARDAHDAPPNLDAATRRRVVQNIWLIWAAWPRHIEVTSTGIRATEAMAQCLRNIALLIQPYLGGDYYAQFEAAGFAAIEH